jgi:GTPase SAR1 family protein
MNTRHDEDYNFIFKIILLGDSSVGKTHLLSRYIRGQLPRTKYPTIGVEFATKPVPLKTGGTVRVQIWDTGKSNIIIQPQLFINSNYFYEVFVSISSIHTKQLLHLKPFIIS